VSRILRGAHRRDQRRGGPPAGAAIQSEAGLPHHGRVHQRPAAVQAPRLPRAREEAKHWYVYFADHLTTTPGKVPAPPTVLKLDTKATVSKAKDGLGLRGHHSCGNKQVSTRLTYLG
jgi:hypothetical protein